VRQEEKSPKMMTRGQQMSCGRPATLYKGRGEEILEICPKVAKLLSNSNDVK
jgi:hypothetical protein